MSLTCAMHSLSYANIDLSADGLNGGGCCAVYMHVHSVRKSKKLHNSHWPLILKLKWCKCTDGVPWMSMINVSTRHPDRNIVANWVWFWKGLDRTYTTEHIRHLSSIYKWQTWKYREQLRPSARTRESHVHEVSNVKLHWLVDFL